jgi:DNA helicase II / ATP-dependent DNA helicase PcrA
MIKVGGSRMFIEKVSPSKIKVYKDCKLKYKLKYVDYLPENFNANTNTDALQFGSYVHEILEHGLECDSVEGLYEIAKDLRHKYVFGEEKAKLLDACITNFFDWNAKLKGETVATELVFAVEYKTFTINGIIDRLLRSPQGNYLVIDYKTSKSPLSKKQLYNDDQLIMYAAAVSKLYNVSPSNITLGHYYPHLDKLVTIVYPPTIVSAYLNNSLDRKIWDIRKRKKDQFPAEKNRFCNWCGFKDICPLYNEGSTLKLEGVIAEHKERKRKEKEGILDV